MMQIAISWDLPKIGICQSQQAHLSSPQIRKIRSLPLKRDRSLKPWNGYDVRKEDGDGMKLGSIPNANKHPKNIPKSKWWGGVVPKTVERLRRKEGRQTGMGGLESVVRVRRLKTEAVTTAGRTSDQCLGRSPKWCSRIKVKCSQLVQQNLCNVSLLVTSCDWSKDGTCDPVQDI